MKIKNYFLILILVSSFANVYSQYMKFEIIAGDFDIPLLPIKIPLAGINTNNDSLIINVFWLNEGQEVAVRNQIEPGYPSKLWIIPEKEIPAKSSATFIIRYSNENPYSELTRAIMDDENIKLIAGENKILNYRYAFYPSPEGVDPLYGKSGFIHPLFSPNGNVLTTIQPDDHYHHYGIWSPWTKVQVEGQEIDFWNLGDGKGTVRFAGLISKFSGSIFSGFKLRQEHVNFKSKGSDKVAINEVWDIKSTPVEIGGRKCWLIDYASVLNNALDSNIEFTNYRYGGGISIRANEYWTNQNSSILTSEGKTRIDADGTRARWCKIEGQFPGGDTSGIVFFSHPNNRAHPEPMRVWPVEANEGRGDVFFEFCPIRHQKWNILPNKEYILQYRMLVFDGEMPTDVIESVWRSYTGEVDINWLSN